MNQISVIRVEKELETWVALPHNADQLCNKTLIVFQVDFI